MVGKVIGTIKITPNLNVYERRVGQTLTPLLKGLIQYRKLKKEPNFDAVCAEVLAIHIAFPPNIKWRDLIELLENHDGYPKFFNPINNYESFKWNDSHLPLKLILT